MEEDRLRARIAPTSMIFPARGGRDSLRGVSISKVRRGRRQGFVREKGRGHLVRGLPDISDAGTARNGCRGDEGFPWLARARNTGRLRQGALPGIRTRDMLAGAEVLSLGLPEVRIEPAAIRAGADPEASLVRRRSCPVKPPSTGCMRVKSVPVREPSAPFRIMATGLLTAASAGTIQ